MKPTLWAAFFIEFVKAPRQVGAIMPCSNAVATAMRLALDTPPPGQPDGDDTRAPAVVELGPGTGRITEQLHAENLTLVETDQTFCELLANRYPEATLLNISAVDFLAEQKMPISVISSIPLLNNPEASMLKKAVAKSYRSGIIQKLVTYSYGSKSPFAECGFVYESRFKQVLCNLPPANIWVYA